MSLTWKKMENGPTFSVIREYIFKLGPFFIISIAMFYQRVDVDTHFTIDLS